MSKHCKCKKSSHKKKCSSSSSSSSSCHCKSSSSCHNKCYKKSSHKKCCDNPWYTKPTSELIEYRNKDVNGYNPGVGNVLTNGYGIVYGAKTPNVYVVTNNFF
jgi:hypothetical protein